MLHEYILKCENLFFLQSISSAIYYVYNHLNLLCQYHYLQDKQLVFWQCRGVGDKRWIFFSFAFVGLLIFFISTSKEFIHTTFKQAEKSRLAYIFSFMTYQPTNDCDDGVLGVVTEDDVNVLDGVEDTGFVVVHGGFTSPGVWGVLFSSVDIWNQYKGIF